MAGDSQQLCQLNPKALPRVGWLALGPDQAHLTVADIVPQVSRCLVAGNYELSPDPGLGLAG